MSVRPPFSRYFGGIGQVLSSPNYRAYWLGQMFHVQGMWIHRVAAAWLMFELTHSPAWLGALGFAMAAPSLLLGPIAGAVSDRVGHRRTSMVAAGCNSASMAALAILTWFDAATPLALAALVAVQATCFAFELPARQALIPMMIERRHMTEAMSLNWATFNVAAFTGPLLGGLLLKAGGAKLAFAVCALTIFWMLISLWRIKITDVTPAGRLAFGGLFDDVFKGIGYIFRHPALPYIMGLHVMTAFMIRPYIEFMPAFAVSVFDRGADGLATLLAASGLGGLAVSVAMTLRARERWLVYILAIGEGCAAAAMLLFTASDIFWVGVIALAFVGALASAAGIASSTLIQLCAEPAYRGRVISVSLAMFIGAPALGSLILGAISEWAGPRAAFAGAALIVILSAAFLGPRLLKRRGSIELTSAVPTAPRGTDPSG